MKSIKLMYILAAAAMCIASCDDTTDNIGGSIVDNLDNVEVKCDTFSVATDTAKVDSVYSRSTSGYLGKVKDPETGAYVTADFITQYYTFEGTQLPAESTIVSRLKNADGTQGEIIADSCILYLYFDNFAGDSLATMKVKAMELSKPMDEKTKYYSNFNREKEYCRTGNGAVNVSKTYALHDCAKDTTGVVRIKLPNSTLSADSSTIIGSRAYIDKDGTGYYNYGTYLMKKFYEDSDNYKNTYNFIHKVCPGFYFKCTDGLGAMANVYLSQMAVYYKYKYEKTNSDGTKKDTTISVISQFASTEEVMQATRVSGDLGNVRLDDCTYIKSPAGVNTVLTLPVDDVMSGHAADSIVSARVSLTRVNNTLHDDSNFPYPSTLLMIENDSIKGFFENGKVTNDKTTFLASYAETSSTVNSLCNSYTFHNISNLIKSMYEKRKRVIGEEPSDKTSSEWTAWNTRRNNYAEVNKNWNKVHVVPVTATYDTSSSSSTQTLLKVENDMSVSGTRLVKGDGLMPADKNDIKVKLFVVYSKFGK